MKAQGEESVLTIQSVPAPNFDAADIFDPEIFLPDQIQKVTNIDSPERRFLVVMLEEAFADVRKQPGQGIESNRSNPKSVDLGSQALAWFLSDEREWPMSFLAICDALDLDPEYWRAAATRLYHTGHVRWGVNRITRAPVANSLNRPSAKAIASNRRRKWMKAWGPRPEGDV